MTKFQDRIEDLRRDPDFRELVRLLRSLDDERRAAWYAQYEHASSRARDHHDTPEAPSFDTSG